MSTPKFKFAQVVRCINVAPLPGREVAPPLNLNNLYRIKQVILDNEGNQHLDVGLASSYNFICSQETNEHLPYGNIHHWCHPSRFKVV